MICGAKPKVISEALGHSSVAPTMDVYNHIIEGMQSDAIALLDEVLPAVCELNLASSSSSLQMVESLDTLSVYLFDATLLTGAFTYWVYSRYNAGQPTIAGMITIAFVNALPGPDGYSPPNLGRMPYHS